jgi:hypothetical protein
MKEVKMKEKTKKQIEADKNTRAVFDKPVQRQGSPIYKVTSMGTCVEFTDKIMMANAAYKEASKPREMWKIAGSQSELLYKEFI